MFVYIPVHFYTSLDGAHNHDSQSLNPAGIPGSWDWEFLKTGSRDWKNGPGLETLLENSARYIVSLHVVHVINSDARQPPLWHARPLPPPLPRLGFVSGTHQRRNMKLSVVRLKNYRFRDVTTFTHSVHHCLWPRKFLYFWEDCKRSWRSGRSSPPSLVWLISFILCRLGLVLRLGSV